MLRPTAAVLATALFGLALLPGAARAELPGELEGNGLPSLASVVDQTAPSVVNIAAHGTIEVQQNPLFNDPFFRKFFGLPEGPIQRETQSVGSGVVMDAENGYVVTNNHVIAQAEEIVITLHDKRQFNAELVGTDPETDIAVLKIEPKNLKAIEFADSDALRVGDYVVAIGNPFGLGDTVTSGIVSALGRSGLGIEAYENFIQTDASINPGNSGGALVDLKGRLVGINTAILGPGGGNIGIGFAIPVNMVREVSQQLVEYGEVQRGQLGVNIQDLNPDLAQAFGIERTQGAVVTQVLPGSPAEAAGIKTGDVVIAVDGREVVSAADLRNRIGIRRVDETVKLTVLREGRETNVKVTIGPRTEQLAQSQAPAPGQGDRRLEGAVIAPLDPSSPLYGEIEGVRVVSVAPDSAAWRAGLRENDVILSVNQKPVTNPDEVYAIAESADQLLLNVRRGEGALFIIIR